MIQKVEHNPRVEHKTINGRKYVRYSCSCSCGANSNWQLADSEYEILE